MDKSNAVAFGTLNTKANVLGENLARPGGLHGHREVPGHSGPTPQVGETRPGGSRGQGVSGSGGGEVFAGSVRPGGAYGQGIGAAVPLPKVSKKAAD